MTRKHGNEKQDIYNYLTNVMTSKQSNEKLGALSASYCNDKRTCNENQGCVTYWSKGQSTLDFFLSSTSANMV